MKKNVLILLVVTLVTIVANMTVAFADAANYDMEPVDYYVYVATPDGGLNMRHGPGTEYPKVMSERIPDGTKLYIGYVSGDWGYTSYKENEGWVCLIDTKKASSSADSYEKEAVDYYVYVATPDGGLNMRQGPSTSYSKIMQERIPDGTKLHIKYVSGDWGYTSYNGYEGWVCLIDTTKNPPEDKKQPSESVEYPPNEPEEKEKVIEGEIEKKEGKETAQTAESADVQNVKKSMMIQILLIACLLLLVIVASVLILVVVNKKSKK